MRVGVKPGQWGWAFAELEMAWTLAEELGFDVLSCFDHVSAAPAGAAAWDAPSLLTAMAGRTERIGLAVDVVNAALRHPFLLAAQIAVAQAASGGRVEVGLGAGSYHLARFDHGPLGIPFPPFEERVARLEACCRALPALWRGEDVTDPVLGLEQASLGPIGIEPPPIVVGGTSDRVLEIAAGCANGWIAARIGPDEFASLANRLPARIRKTAQVFVHDVEPTRELVERFAAAGADTVTFVLTDEEEGAEGVRRLAEAVLV